MLSATGATVTIGLSFAKTGFGAKAITIGASGSGCSFIQISTAYLWDQHEKLVSGHEKIARAVDRPISGLLTDLKARGLLDVRAVFGGDLPGNAAFVDAVSMALSALHAEGAARTVHRAVSGRS